MKLIKTIKLHLKLRSIQEVLCEDCSIWSQKMYKCQEYKTYPKLSEFSAVNRAVKKIEKKLPNIYFFLGDLFGFSQIIKNKKQKIIKNEKN